MFSRRKSSESNALPVPPNASLPSSREVLRVWETRGAGQEVTLLPSAFADANGRVDPSAWGILLADVARHVANAYQDTVKADPKVVLGRIRAGFDAEWDHPTDTPEHIKG